MNEKTLKLIDRVIVSWKYENAKKDNAKNINMALCVSNKDDLFINIEVEGKPIRALCDTGADLNLIDLSLVGNHKLGHTMITARAASGHKITILGICVIFTVTF